MQVTRLPKFEEFMLPLLRLAADRKIWKVADAREEVLSELGLSDIDLSERVANGREPVVNNRFGWAKEYLTKALLLESAGHGFFQITERGTRVIEQTPKQIDSDFLMQFEEFAKYKKANESKSRKNASVVNFRVTIKGSRAVIDIPSEKLQNVLSALNG